MFLSSNSDWARFADAIPMARRIPEGRLQQLVAEAEAALAQFGKAAAVLIEGARFVAARKA